MILLLIAVVLPVFLLLGSGALAARCGIFPIETVDGVMYFTQNFAIPCLLFAALVDLDLRAVFDPALLLSFYLGAVASFVLGVIGARVIFKRRPGEAISVGFGALFSNSVLLGLPIIERAFGAEALAPSFAIVSIHAPFCYLLGIVSMEAARTDGYGVIDTVRAVVRMIFHNALMIGLLLGFAVNLSGIAIPQAVSETVDLMAGVALPVSLFGLGGVLTRYALRTQLGEAGMIAVISLVVHPAITLWLSVWVFGLPDMFVRAAVVTAAMAPGVNVYFFANLYRRGQAQAASVVLLGTTLSIFTVSLWLALLGHLLD